MRHALVVFHVSFLTGVLLLCTHGAGHPASAQVPARNQPRAVETYGKLPLAFEACLAVSCSQTDPPVRFLSRGRGYTLFLTPQEAVLRFGNFRERSQQIPQTGAASTTSAMQATASAAPTVIRMRLAGANPEPQMTGMNELPGKSNYFIGNDPKKWRTNVPRYAKVRYQDVYPGVDLIYYGNQRQLEYDFVVAPGADPEPIQIDIQGAEKLEIEADGDLVLYFASGKIRLRKPLIYQEKNGQGEDWQVRAGIRQEIAGGYVLRGRNQVGFQVADYDRNQPLVIDPVLVYSSYLGGDFEDFGADIAVDSNGNAYITGQTGSTDFPTATPFQPAFGGGGFPGDAFVTKLNAAGDAIVYSTYLGGSGLDLGESIAVDSNGNAYVTGKLFPLISPQRALSGLPMVVRTTRS